MSREVVYIVTCFERKPRDPDDESEYRGYPNGHRAWGWYNQFVSAENDVLANATDMFECAYYEYAVIEEFREGILTFGKQIGWYRADPVRAVEGKTRPELIDLFPDVRVSKCDSPTWINRGFNFGIG